MDQEYKEKLCDFFADLAEAERRVQVVKEMLGKDPEFDPKKLFQLVAGENKEEFSIHQLGEFFKHQKVNFSNEGLTQLFDVLDICRDGLITVDSFTKYIQPAVRTNNDFYNQQRIAHTDHGLLRVFEEELKSLAMIEKAKSRKLTGLLIDKRLIFNAMCGEGNHFSLFSDFYGFMKTVFPTTLEEVARRAFQRIDHNRDKKIDYLELSDLLKNISNVMTDYGQQVRKVLETPRENSQSNYTINKIESIEKKAVVQFEDDIEDDYLLTRDGDVINQSPSKIKGPTGRVYKLDHNRTVTDDRYRSPYSKRSDEYGNRSCINAAIYETYQVLDGDKITRNATNSARENGKGSPFRYSQSKRGLHEDENSNRIPTYRFSANRSPGYANRSPGYASRSPGYDLGDNRDSVRDIGLRKSPTTGNFERSPITNTRISTTTHIEYRQSRIPSSNTSTSKYTKNYEVLRKTPGGRTLHGSRSRGYKREGMEAKVKIEDALQLSIDYSNNQAYELNKIEYQNWKRTYEEKYKQRSPINNDSSQQHENARVRTQTRSPGGGRLKSVHVTEVTEFVGTSSNRRVTGSINKQEYPTTSRFAAPVNQYRQKLNTNFARVGIDEDIRSWTQKKEEEIRAKLEIEVRREVESELRKEYEKKLRDATEKANLDHLRANEQLKAAKQHQALQNQREEEKRRAYEQQHKEDRKKADDQRRVDEQRRIDEQQRADDKLKMEERALKAIQEYNATDNQSSNELIKRVDGNLERSEMLNNQSTLKYSSTEGGETIMSKSKVERIEGIDRMKIQNLSSKFDLMDGKSQNAYKNEVSEKFASIINSIVQDFRKLEEKRVSLSLRFDFSLEEFFNNTVNLDDLGKINFEVFKKMLNAIRSDLNDSEARSVFNQFDENADSILQKSELITMLCPFGDEYRDSLLTRTARNIEDIQSYSNETKTELRRVFEAIHEDCLMIENRKTISKDLLVEYFITLDKEGMENFDVDTIIDLLDEYDYFASIKEIKAVMKVFDKDNDGEISFSEMLVGLCEDLRK